MALLEALHPCLPLRWNVKQTELMAAKDLRVERLDLGCYRSAVDPLPNHAVRQQHWEKLGADALKHCLCPKRAHLIALLLDQDPAQHLAGERFRDLVHELDHANL